MQSSTPVRGLSSYVKMRFAAEKRIFICAMRMLTGSSAVAQNVNVASSHSVAMSPYTVDGFIIGTRIEFKGPTYHGYQCSPSEQFPEFTRCQRTQRQQGPWDRRHSESRNSI